VTDNTTAKVSVGAQLALFRSPLVNTADAFSFRREYPGDGLGMSYFITWEETDFCLHEIVKKSHFVIDVKRADFLNRTTAFHHQHYILLLPPATATSSSPLL